MSSHATQQPQRCTGLRPDGRYGPGRRTACIALTALLAAGCSSGSGTRANGPAASGSTAATAEATPATTAPGPATTVPAPPTSTPSAPPTAVTPSASAATVAPCTTAHLRISVGGGSGGAAGSVYTAVNFRNTGSGTCTMVGHPGVSYVSGADGHQIGNAARRELTGTLVTLRSGAVASATLRILEYGVYDANLCRSTDVRGFRIYPPGQTASAFVAGSGRACSGRSAPQLSVRPVKAGPPTG